MKTFAPSTGLLMNRAETICRISSFLLLIMLAVSSCATSPAKDQAPEGSAMTVLLEKNRYVQSVKMSGSVSLKNMNLPVDSRATILFKRPNSFRVTFFDPIGTAWFLAVSNSEELGLFIPSEGRKEIWPSGSEKGLVKIGPLKISKADFLRFIYPGLEERWLWQGGSAMRGEILWVNFPEAEYKLRFDAEKRLSRVEITREGSADISVSYTYRPDGGLSVELGSLVKFEFEKIEIVEDIPANLFKIPSAAAG
ncbi:MAG: hypothetical protein OEY64_00065 [Nitrospinota bacterium]|nr:hypothetical protein [Nitrospinota bacterium]